MTRANTRLGQGPIESRPRFGTLGWMLSAFQGPCASTPARTRTKNLERSGRPDGRQIRIGLGPAKDDFRQRNGGLGRLPYEVLVATVEIYFRVGHGWCGHQSFSSPRALGRSRDRIATERVNPAGHGCNVLDAADDDRTCGCNSSIPVPYGVRTYIPGGGAGTSYEEQCTTIS